MRREHLYYNQDGIIVRDSNIHDVHVLQDNLRHSDVEEIWASHHQLPDVALKTALESSIICLTVYCKEPIAMFGIGTPKYFSREAPIWFLSSDKIDDIRIRFLRNSKKFIEYFLRIYPTLVNYVDARNVESIKWLWFLGANIEEAKPYGIEQKPFHRFTFRRKDAEMVT